MNMRKPISRSLLSVIASFLFVFPVLGQGKQAKQGLKVYIDSLFTVDQQVQQDMINAFQRSAPFDSIKVLEDIQKQTFARHIQLLKDVVKTHGYPASEKVGAETSSHFFTLIQHADADVNFQAEMLPLIKEQVDKKQANGSEYAFLYDRIQINKGGEQLYGTQVEYDAEGNAVPKKLKDQSDVNARRKSVGLAPLEEYLKKVTEMHKKMNQRNN